MHLVGYLYEDYHDARSLEHKVPPAICALSPIFSGAAASEDETCGTKSYHLF